MSEYLGGISPTSAGYESYEIAPQALFDTLSVGCDTVRGRIEMKYVRSADSTVFTLKTIDADCTVRIPLEFGTEISGTGFENKGVEDDCTVLEITEAGAYTLTVK